MKLYRFSPINSEQELQDVIEYLHFESFRLCKNSFGRYLPVAGNLGIFCHYDDEYNYLTKIREKLTEESDNLNQKYYRLKTPITISAREDIPETTYTYLYVRKADPYRHHVGDIDFVLEDDEYQELKEKMKQGYPVPDARLFPSPRLDMIELYHPDSDVLAYVTTGYMADEVHVTKSES